MSLVLWDRDLVTSTTKFHMQPAQPTQSRCWLPPSTDLLGACPWDAHNLFLCLFYPELCPKGRWIERLSTQPEGAVSGRRSGARVIPRAQKTLSHFLFPYETKITTKSREERHFTTKSRAENPFKSNPLLVSSSHIVSVVETLCLLNQLFKAGSSPVGSSESQTLPDSFLLSISWRSSSSSVSSSDESLLLSFLSSTSSSPPLSLSCSSDCLLSLSASLITCSRDSQS